MIKLQGSNGMRSTLIEASGSKTFFVCLTSIDYHNVGHMLCKLIGLEPLFVAVLYNPPEKSKYRISIEDTQKLFRFFEETCSKRLLFTGDFNMPRTNWSSYDSVDDYENQIASLVFDLNLKYNIDFNTTKKSCLDLVFCNENSIINDTKLCGKLSRFSVHFPITINVSINGEIPEKLSTRYFSYCNCDFDALNEDIIANPFEPYCYSNVDVNTNLWYEWIFQLIEKHVPIRTKNRQLLPPWTSAGTSHHMSMIKTERRKLRKKGLCTSEKLKRLTEECDQLQTNDRVDYEQKVFASRLKGRIFKYFKNLKRDSLPPVMKSESLKKEATTDLERANLFNNYFATVVTDDDYEYFQPSEQHVYRKNDIRITEDLIKTELRSLDISKIRGHDSIPPILFKKCGGQLLRPFEICSIISSDWANFHLHGRLELSVRYTKMVTKEVSNYRPVTLLNIISKSFEKFIFAPIYTAFASLISSFQFGFRPRRSVVLQLLNRLPHIYSYLLTLELERLC